MIMPMPCHTMPVIKRYAAAGTQTSAEPITGTNEKIPHIMPQNQGSGIWNNQNESEELMPWITAISGIPIELESVMDSSPLMNRFTWFSSIGVSALVQCGNCL